MSREVISRAEAYRLPADAVRCDAVTEFGNPFRIVSSVSPRTTRWWVEHKRELWFASSQEDAHQLALTKYERWIWHPDQAALRALIIERFRGKRPACSCPAAMACHADFIVKLANNLFAKNV